MVLRNIQTEMSLCMDLVKQQVKSEIKNEACQKEACQVGPYR